MSVTPAALYLPQHPEGSTPWRPPGPYQGTFEEYDYVEEEWFATGEVDGRRYTTPVLLCRPRDVNRFSGTVIVEPIHFFPVLPIWMYTSRYIMRSGHAWAYVASYASSVDGFVKPHDPRRYRAVHIEEVPRLPEAIDLDFVNLPMDPNPAVAGFWWWHLHRQNPTCQGILAQVGAALKASAGPLEGYGKTTVVLTGHSGTGDVTSNYIREAHDVLRLEDGGPVYDGIFPSGWPTAAFARCDVPIVQVVTQGDISFGTAFYRDGYAGLGHRRHDSDDSQDAYRLYELAGLAHTSTQYPPTNDYTFLEQFQPVGVWPKGVEMSSLPFDQLFALALDHLVHWSADGVVPPRGDRLELDDRTGFFATDEHGNPLGGVRCAHLDVPRATYISNLPGPNGEPEFTSFGFQRPFEKEKLRSLYGDSATYEAEFDRRLGELISERWFLAADADEVRVNALQVDM
jgi:Alpha/beta hydrolase domain